MPPPRFSTPFAPLPPTHPSNRNNCATLGNARPLLGSPLFLPQPLSQAPADAPPSRPVRSAGRKRKGNPYAALGDDSDSDDSNGTNSSSKGLAGGGGSSSKGLTFASPSGFARLSGGASAGSGGSLMAGRGGFAFAGPAQTQAASDDYDPDL